jgi:hypothetical protein
MKFRSAIPLIVALLFAACGGGSESPTEVAKKFLDHTNKLEFKEAKAYSTKATGELLDMITGMAGMMGEQPPAPAYTIVGETIDGDKATVTYRSEGEQADESINLVKEDGKWLVSISKEDLDKEGDAGDMNMDMDMDLDMEADTMMDESPVEAAQ